MPTRKKAKKVALKNSEINRGGRSASLVPFARNPSRPPALPNERAKHFISEIDLHAADCLRKLQELRESEKKHE